MFVYLRRISNLGSTPHKSPHTDLVMDPSTPALDLSSTPHSRNVDEMTQDAAFIKRGASPHTVGRSYTDPNLKPPSLKVKKRIIVCCDGWVVEYSSPMMG